VLADRFDCRSRRAARGQERPGVKSARKRPRSSHPPLRSGAAKERRKPGHGGKALIPVAGSRSRAVVSTRKGGRRAEWALVDGRRLGSSGTAAFDGAAGKSGLGGGQRVERRGARSRQEVSEVGAHSPPAEDNAADRRASLRGLADIGAHQGIRDARNRRIGGSVSGIRPKRVERRQARHGPARLLGLAPWGRPPRKR